MKTAIALIIAINFLAAFSFAETGRFTGGLDKTLIKDTVRITNDLAGIAWEKYFIAADADKLLIYPSVQKIGILALNTYNYLTAGLSKESASLKCSVLAGGYSVVSDQISTNYSKIFLEQVSEYDKRKIETEIANLVKQKKALQNRFQACLSDNYQIIEPK
jgi:hypothetical protein